MSDLVSILIPAYNAEKWIGACLKSAISQTWQRTEVIVVDDGSRDSTLDVARLYESAKVRVVSQENGGASAARNRALSLAQGDYIQWMDADDILAADKISLQLINAERGIESKILLSGAWGKFYHCPDKTHFAPSALWRDLEPLEWLFQKIDLNLWMAIESWLVSRKLTQLAGPWDERLSLDDDGEYFCRVLSAAAGVRFVADARCYCRRGSVSSMSHSFTLSDAKLNSQFAAIQAYVRHLRGMEDSPRTRAACLKLLQRIAIYFYPERPDLFDLLSLLATDLGGVVDPPALPLKYRWVKNVFGWKVAKKAHYVLPAVRALLETNRERLQCYRLHSTGDRAHA
jgi:glycosyltransferase involved in cell wall biosynthesis